MTPKEFCDVVNGLVEEGTRKLVGGRPHVFTKSIGKGVYSYGLPPLASGTELPVKVESYMLVPDNGQPPLTRLFVYRRDELEETVRFWIIPEDVAESYPWPDIVVSTAAAILEATGRLFSWRTGKIFIRRPFTLRCKGLFTEIAMIFQCAGRFGFDEEPAKPVC